MFTHDPRSAKVSKGFESPNLQGRVNNPGSSIFAARTSRTSRLRYKSWNSSSRVGPSSTGYGGSVSISGCCRLVWEMTTSLKCSLIALIELEGRIARQRARYSIGDGLQHSVDFVGHLALLLFEIGFKLRSSSVLRCHELENQSFYIRLVVKILRTVVEGTVRDQTIMLEPVSPRVFCSGLKVVSEQDELPSSIGLEFRARLDGDRIVMVMKLTTGRLVNGSSCDGIDMVLKKSRLGAKGLCHDEGLFGDIIAEFCGPSRWKELSKESGSKILPCGDGSCWKVFKPIASLIT
ncbi:hypothetical protein Tco_0779652 [Tanacetum coccineum]